MSPKVHKGRGAERTPNRLSPDVFSCVFVLGFTSGLRLPYPTQQREEITTKLYMYLMQFDMHVRGDICHTYASSMLLAKSWRGVGIISSSTVYNACQR